MHIYLITLLIVICLLLLLLCYLLKPVKATNKQITPFYHRNFAHRGLHTKDKQIPENSATAFLHAVNHNYGIELDLQFSKDFQIVVFHDDTLTRVCGVDKRVDELSYDELQQLSLCQTKERIPLFSDVLKIVNGKVPLIVEIKTGSNNPRLCEAAYNMLKDYQGDYCIESFDPFIVKWFRLNAPHILRGQLSAPYSSLKKELEPFKAFFLGNCLSNFISRPNFIAYDKISMPFTVKLAYSLGAMPIVWTVRDTDPIKLIESKNEAVIFEFYHPTSQYD